MDQLASLEPADAEERVSSPEISPSLRLSAPGQSARRRLQARPVGSSGRSKWCSRHMLRQTTLRGVGLPDRCPIDRSFGFSGYQGRVAAVDCPVRR